MRVIKFKAYDKIKKEMVFDALEYELRLLSASESCLEPVNEIIGFFPETDGRIFEVMQCTELKDKKDNEIWEGDIVEYKQHDQINNKYTSVTLEVVFNNGSFEQVHGDIFDDIAYNSVSDIWYDWDEVTVIGNIYENPELINKEGEQLDNK